MATTAFIKPIPNNKGIFYTFKSAEDDIMSTFNHDHKKFRFSKFVLLDIPPMGVPNGIQNKMQFLAVGETPIMEGISAIDYNENLANSFQDYCLNMEALIMSQDSFNISLRRTIAERVFWKWIKESGAIRFRETENTVSDEEKDYSVLGEEHRYVEEDEEFSGDPPVTEYTRMVKYVGEIDVILSRKGTNAYSMIYIYVPTSVGSTPYVMFKCVSDDNYYEDMMVLNEKAAYENIEYLSGRNYDDTHPYNLDVKAYYDLDDGGVDSEVSAQDPVSYSTGYWFTGTNNDAYYTDVAFEVATNQWIRRTYQGTVVEHLRSQLDGLVIDFNLENYKLANENSLVHTFAQFNEYVGSENFKYNAILIYYDIIDEGDDVTAEPVTNLFGIQFLNQVEAVTYEFEIPQIEKFMPDMTSKTNGNAFAHVINIKFDTSTNTVSVEKSVNDYTNIGMDLFLDALSNVSALNDAFEENLNFMVNLKNELDSTNNNMLNETSKQELISRIETLEDSYTASQALFDNTTAVMNLIDDLYTKYNDIIDSKTVEVTYKYNKRELNNLIDKNQSFNLATSYTGNLLDNDELVLIPYSNYYKHVADDKIVLTNDFILYINDKQFNWENGQSFEIVFGTEFDLDGNYFKIYTDFNNVKNTGVGGYEVVSLDEMFFEDSAFMPIIRVMCVDAKSLTFEVDKIR